MIRGIDPQSDPEVPLAGLCVVELSERVAGAYCGKLLADAGADVIKVEPPGGDPMRRWSASGTPIAPGDDGRLFQFLNTSKRSIALALSSPRDLATARELAAGASLVVEDLGPGVVESIGLGIDDLRA